MQPRMIENKVRRYIYPTIPNASRLRTLVRLWALSATKGFHALTASSVPRRLDLFPKAAHRVTAGMACQSGTLASAGIK